MQVEPPSDESAAAAAALSLLNATPSSELTASQPPGYPSAALPAPPVLDPAAGTQMPMPMASPYGIPPFGMAPGWAPPGAYGMMMPSDAQPADMLGKRRRGEQPNKQGWTRQEDALILKTVREVGTKWSRIAAQLPGRSDDAVRNRYIRMKVRPAPAPPQTFLLSPGARPGGPPRPGRQSHHGTRWSFTVTPPLASSAEEIEGLQGRRQGQGGQRGGRGLGPR